MSYQNRSLREIIEDNNTALVASIATETSRAQTAEQANAAAILAEEQRVDAILLNAPPLLDTFKEVVDAYEAADQSLTLITNNNTNNITANSNALSAEITRATAAESANTTAITNEVARATGAESANATDIATETTRATTAETANTTAINNEIARATAAEGANTTNLNTEITRAQTAEGLNTTNLNAEITRAIAAEGLNTSNLNAEITRATNAETANATAIATKQNTITGSTPLTTGVLTATQSTNDIDIRNNISAGTGINLTQNGNITQIASTGGGGVNLPNPIIGVKMWVGATSAGGTNVIKLVNGQVPANSTRQVFECSAYTFIESSSNGSSWTCDFDCDYEYAGSASDTVKSKIYWRINNGSWQEQGHRNQKFTAAGGGGTRSGVIFPAHISKPLSLSYNAGDTIKMRVDVITNGDDILYVRSGTNETKCTAVFQEIKEGNVNNVNSSTNLTVASITATGSTNDIDLRNNIIAGTGINLTQISNTTGIAVDPAPLAAEIARATAAEGANATNIATNTTNIATNTTDIASNTTAIATNTTNIASNTTDIATNATNIATNTTNIATNTTNIATNTTDIAANATAIATKQDTITGSTALTTGALTATTATNDIYIGNNISAGSNITLTQNGNITQIASSGGGAATSTQYYFKAKGSGNQSISTGATNQLIDFNVLVFQNPTGYNTTNKEYVVQVAGLYQFFYQLFFLMNNANAEVRFGLYLTRGGTTSTISQNGQVIFTAERLGLTYECLVGDKISVRVVYNNSGGVFNVEKGQSWFEGYLLQPVNNTVTSSTALTAATITAQGTTNDIDLRNNISAGSNITLTQTGNVTSIASSGSPRIVFSAVRSSTLTPVNNTNVLYMPYDSTKITNSSNFSLSGDTLTILVAGDYLISATVNWENYSFTVPNPPRYVGRMRTITNNTFVGGTDAIALCYGRNKDYGRFESTTFTQYPRTFAANDTLKIEVTVIKSSESLNFISNFNGLRFVRGGNLTVEKIN